MAKKRNLTMATVIEEPPGSNHYQVIDGGGWLNDDREYSHKELLLACDAIEIEYGAPPPGGWIQIDDTQRRRVEPAPGPWHVDQNQIRDRDGWALASVPYTLGDAADFENARLMAMAPELLSAARAALHLLTADYERIGQERNCDAAYLVRADRYTTIGLLREVVGAAGGGGQAPDLDPDTRIFLQFLAETWRKAPGQFSPVYQLLSDAALGLVNLPTEQERLDAAAWLAGRLVALGVGAGLTLGELRGLAGRLGDALTEAIVEEVDR